MMRRKYCDGRGRVNLGCMVVGAAAGGTMVVMARREWWAVDAKDLDA